MFSQGGSWRTANTTAVPAGDTHKAAPRSQHPHLCCKVQFPAFHHQNTGSTHHSLSRQQREVSAASRFTSRHVCQICSSHSRSRPLPSSLTFPIQPFCVKLNSYLFAFRIKHLKSELTVCRHWGVFKQKWHQPVPPGRVQFELGSVSIRGAAGAATGARRDAAPASPQTLPEDIYKTPVLPPHGQQHCVARTTAPGVARAEQHYRWPRQRQGQEPTRNNENHLQSRKLHLLDETLSSNKTCLDNSSFITRLFRC